MITLLIWSEFNFKNNKFDFFTFDIYVGTQILKITGYLILVFLTHLIDYSFLFRGYIISSFVCINIF